MIKAVRRLFAGLFLFLISGAAWATDFTSGTAVSDHTDLSMGYLGQVFGTVGNVLQGSSGQMLGQLFYKLNEGIIVVAGLWLSYTVFTIVIRSAQEGSFMGANKNVALVFLKIAVGFGLLVPNPSTGYSLLQDVVMKVVVQGVGLADQTWQYGLRYVQNGGSVWHRPIGPTGGPVITQQAIMNILGGSAQNVKGPGEQVFANEVCMYSSNDNQNTPYSSNVVNTGVAVNNTPSVQYDIVTDDAAHRFEFPGVGNTSPIGPGSQNCGYVSWDIQGACTGANSTDTKCQMAKEAVSELVTGLQPAAKKYYCSQHASAGSCVGTSHDNVTAENEEYFFNSVINYANIMLPLVQLNTAGLTTQTQFVNEAINEGWLSAGRYYWDLSQVQSTYDNIATLANYAPSAGAPILSGNPSVDANNALNDSYNYINQVVNLALYAYSNQQTAGDTGTGGGNGASQYWGLPPVSSVGNAFEAMGLSLAGAVLTGAINDIANLINLFTTASDPGKLADMMGPDPILFLHKVGMACINVAADLWLGWLGLIAGVMSAAGVCNAVYAAEDWLGKPLEWVKPLLMIIASALWAAGFILGFFLPMYPYIIYTFGVIGWLIAVIEAMVAAPLVCFGLTHPEGHDFLGEAKQAMMLLLSVFLRPVLMVIGLIASMILSYVSLKILVYTFSGFVSDLFYASAPSGGPASGSIIQGASQLMFNSMLNSTSYQGYVLYLLVFPLILVIFAALVYVVTTQCFSLIYALPDNILRWIGGPQQNSPAAELARQVQGSVSNMAGSLSKGVETSKQEAGRREELARQARIIRGGR